MTAASQQLLSEILDIWQQLDPRRRRELEDYAAGLVVEQRAERP